MTDDAATPRAATISAALAVLGIFALYANSFHVPFLLDDEVTILANPSIRDLTDLSAVFTPPAHVFSAGRPVVNFSFALNYAVSGTSVAGYHFVNVLIHALSCLALFGLVRRVLELPQFRWETPGTPRTLALVAAALWALHPLQTAAVTYVSQRAESLMALFYLLTLYAFVRAASDADSRRWGIVSMVAGLLGVLTKETMVTAPLAVLLCDRVFFSGSFFAALRARTALYAGYAVTWLALAWLMIAQHLTTRGVGFENGVTPFAYGLAETRAFTRYLALTFWPQPLVFDYGVEFLNASALEALGGCLFVAVAISLAIYCWRRSLAVGFCGAAFLLILAPTTSIVPIALQPMAESRMYLPLAALIVLLAVGLNAAVGSRRAVALGIAAALAFAGVTVARNHDFRSAVNIWTDTVAKRADSSRARNNLGLALLAVPGHRAEAIAQFETALRLKPGFLEVHNNLGNALAELPGRLDDAIAHYSAAIRAKPTFAQAHANLANALLRTPGHATEAFEHYRTALALQPENAALHANFATVLAADSTKRGEALQQFEIALRLDSRHAAAHAGFARLLTLDETRRAEAVPHYEAALRLDPTDAEAAYNFANLLATDPATLSRARENYETALRLNPNLGAAYNNLAIVLYRLDRIDDAIAQLELAQRRGVANEATLKNLEQLRAIRAR